MRRILTLLLTCVLYYPSICQTGQLIQNKAILFQLNHNHDTVEFIVVDTKIDQKKPIFLWCQGSLPQPLFGELEKDNFYFQGGGIANFNYSDIVKDYHLVIVSIPKTPVIAQKENLNNSFLFIPDANQPNALLKEFIEADYLDNYVKRANVVLDFLKERDWVKTDELVVAGHSQGTKVATKIALNSDWVSHLALFSPNPMGRIDEFVRKARLDAQTNKMTWEEADSIMNSYYDFFKRANNPDSIRNEPRLKAWKTFSEPMLDDWLALHIPIYIAYGTEDISSDICDLVPLFFIGEDKSNLELRRYLNLEHNFFKIEIDGSVNYQDSNWPKVMSEFLDWKKGAANNGYEK